jgi:hypothetical protein
MVAHLLKGGIELGFDAPEADRVAVVLVGLKSRSPSREWTGPIQYHGTPVNAGCAAGPIAVRCREIT